MRTFRALVASALLLCTPAFGYYHFTHYLSRTAPYFPIPEKFDLNLLPGKTVSFYVSDSGPVAFSGSDSFPSLISQIRQATQVWNSVDTSDLRVGFGGLAGSTPPQNTPAGDVVFVDDLGPGVRAVGGPTVTGPSNGSFVPITRSQIRISRDLSRAVIGPSYMEAFFNTIVHEMGHALGLQHTWTSSAMSVAVTRATSRSKPIDADDIAGLSLLYPGKSFAGSYGSITGTVTSNGVGAHLWSVVALRVNGAAISTLTLPDGSYRIDGLPSGQYLVYAHPLPPATQVGLGPGDIRNPVDANGFEMTASNFATETLFYPNVRNSQSALPVSVFPGGVSNGINLSLARRSFVPIYDVSSYSFPDGKNAVRPSYMNSSSAIGTIVALGAGLTSGSGAAPGLAVQVLGGAVTPYSIRPYQSLGSDGFPQTNLAVDLQFSPFAGTGPRHLVFTTNNDLYVLPSGLNLVSKAPPTVNSVQGNGDGSVTLNGTNFNNDSKFYFDGLPATLRAYGGSDAASTAIVTPPTGAPNQTATVAVYNSDGQNSMFMQAINPPTYQYPASDSANILVNPPSMPSGASSYVEITGINTHFTDPQTAVGFGSSDIAVRRVFVLSDTRMFVDVSVAPNTVQQAYEVSVITGFRPAAQPLGFTVTGANPRVPNISLPLVNGNAVQTGLYPGAVTTVYGANFTSNPTGIGTTITIADIQAQVLFVSSTQINFLIPNNVPIGPAVVRISNGVDSALPVVIQIDPQPSAIFQVVANGVVIDANHPAIAGQIAIATVSGLDASMVLNPSRIHLNEGGVDLVAIALAPSPLQSTLMQVQFALSPTVRGDAVPLTISVDGGASSLPIFLTVR